MTPINQDLLKALEEKLGVKRARVYQLIDEVAQSSFLERPDAALVLAARNKISARKYSTLEQRQRLAGGNGQRRSAIAGMSPGSNGHSRARATKALSLDLSHVADPTLADILRRDTAELNALVSLDVARVAKSCMILAGSISEAMLLDCMLAKPLADRAAAIAALPATSRLPGPDPREWSLDNLIKVAQVAPISLVREDIAASSRVVKDWRNLVHPGVEMRHAAARQAVTTKRANGALAFVEMLAEELGLTH